LLCRSDNITNQYYWNKKKKTLHNLVLADENNQNLIKGHCSGIELPFWLEMPGMMLRDS